jgi:anaerobic selenocysteine-containing dehydrogenase
VTTHDQHTFCRICEPLCGLIATVEDGVLVRVRPDKDHVHSGGFMCTKAPAMVEVTYDDDRVLTPLKRTGAPGVFVPVSWDEAMEDIAHRLRQVRSEHGADSVATFWGNPPAFSYATMLTLSGFQEALAVKWRYNINAEDAASRTVANHLLYGSALGLHLPDLWRSHFALIVGANPFVSRGSLVSEPRFKEALDSIVGRGGRVVVVDPRRTETARRYEHVPVRAGTDAWLLLALLHVVVTEDLVDHTAIDELTTGFDELARLVAPFDPHRAAPDCGVDPETVREVARALAAAPSAVVYGRHGACTQAFGTLNNLLLDILSIVTGNYCVPGGLVPAWGPIDIHKLAEAAGMGTYGAVHSRTTGFPDVIGALPATSLATDITEPGEGRIRALFGIGCNPVLTSGGGGERLEAALEGLDLHVSLDLYVNETNKHADYVLPVPGFFERDDIPMIGLGLMLRPSFWVTEAVIPTRGDSRPEWEILDEIVRRQGLGGAYPAAVLRRLAKAGVRLSPRTMFDLLLRTSRVGDWFGLRRRGVSFAKLARHWPSGRPIRDDLPIPERRSKLRTADKRIRLDLPELRAELERLQAWQTDPAFPLRVIGMREVRSHNSWMHNAERLMPDTRRHRALVHPTDAGAAGIADGDHAVLASRAGEIEIEVSVTEDMLAGNIAVPHAWGHRGGWRRANRAGGSTSNVLASPEPDALEPLAGMTVLSGIPVRLDRLAPRLTPPTPPTPR